MPAKTFFSFSTDAIAEFVLHLNPWQGYFSVRNPCMLDTADFKAAYSDTIWKVPLAVAMLLAADQRFEMGL